MTASAEPLGRAWLVRVHPAGGSYRDGSPYYWACVLDPVCDRFPEVCEIKGVTLPGTPAAWRAAEGCARSLGFRERFYLRHTPRGTRADYRGL